jgi:hypothetical protein
VGETCENRVSELEFISILNGYNREWFA